MIYFFKVEFDKYKNMNFLRCLIHYAESFQEVYISL